MRRRRTPTVSLTTVSEALDYFSHLETGFEIGRAVLITLGVMLAAFLYLYQLVNKIKVWWCARNLVTKDFSQQAELYVGMQYGFLTVGELKDECFRRILTSLGVSTLSWSALPGTTRKSGSSSLLGREQGHLHHLLPPGFHQ